MTDGKPCLLSQIRSMAEVESAVRYGDVVVVTLRLGLSFDGTERTRSFPDPGGAHRALIERSTGRR